MNHKIDPIVRRSRPTLKHRLIVAEQVAIFVALPMFAIGAYFGYNAHAQAAAQIDKAVEAATATPTPTPAPKG